MKQLHRGALWLFRIQGLIGFVFLLFFSGFFIVPEVLFFAALFGIEGVFVVFVVVLLVLLALTLGASELYARMSYNRWLYDIGKKEIEIRHGIIWKRHTSIPYSRVQNVDIRRGAIAQMAGFSKVVIQTAGVSGSAQAEGNIPAVGIDEAERIRKSILKKIHHRRSGL